MTSGMVKSIGLRGMAGVDRGRLRVVAIEEIVVDGGGF